MSSPHCRESRHFSLGPLLTPANPITTDPYPIRTLIFTHFSQTHCPSLGPQARAGTAYIHTVPPGSSRKG